MELLTFKTLWGHTDTSCAEALEDACQLALAAGFQGIEGPSPENHQLRDQFTEQLTLFGLEYIAEICTAGRYIPDRNATLRQHLDDLERQLQQIQPLEPLLINCLGGCDRWSLQTSLAFFQEAMTLADKYQLNISFETHRGRCLYSPWSTEKVLEKIPLPLTCDFSHWCVVCEGLGESEDDLMQQVAEHAHHVHGRIGYDQGPQVSDPGSPLYQQDLDKHLGWWRWIWQAQAKKGFSYSTFTPEFGPDGYQMVDPQTLQSVGDLNEINCWMARTASREFTNFAGVSL